MKSTSLREYLKSNRLLMDGAMGTYYRSLYPESEEICEMANTKYPDRILSIHQEYIDAGASLIKTNTFSANPYTMNGDWAMVEETLEAGYRLALQAAGDTAFVAACIGQVKYSGDVENLTGTEDQEIYERLIRFFYNMGARLFIFETFSDGETLRPLLDLLSQLDEYNEALVLFSTNGWGYSKKGISLQKMIDEVKGYDQLAGIGVNCGVGAGHMRRLLQSVDMSGLNFMASPNAGYPEHLMERSGYQNNDTYFAEQMLSICSLGVKVLGGCCGTTPSHIKAIAKGLKNVSIHPISLPVKVPGKKRAVEPVENKFYHKLQQGQFVVAVELDPPYETDIHRMMEAAHLLKASSVDIITIADSPLGRARLDSIMMACKIKREVGIDVIPHLCCRDKNRIAIRAMVSAAYVEEIRNLLLVTGDPLSESEYDGNKGVFNMNSVQLMDYVSKMNEAYADEDQLIFGGALNPKLPNTQRVIERTKAKMKAGADYFLTQPIFAKEDLAKLTRIKEETGAKIIGGIMPLVSYKNAQFIHNEFAGMNVSQEVLGSFRPEMTRQEAEDNGIAIAVEMARQMRASVDGFYFMTPFNRGSMIVKILKSIRDIL